MIQNADDCLDGSFSALGKRKGGVDDRAGDESGRFDQLSGRMIAFATGMFARYAEEEEED